MLRLPSFLSKNPVGGVVRAFHTTLIAPSSDQVTEKLVTRPLAYDAARQRLQIARQWDNAKSTVVRDPEGSISRFNLPSLRAGQMYSLADLSLGRIRATSRAQLNETRGTDLLRSTRLDPNFIYKHYNIMSDFVTQMGRIRPRRITGVSARDQRAIARAIRRAKAAGLMPANSKHPERPLQQALASLSSGYSRY